MTGSKSFVLQFNNKMTSKQCNNMCEALTRQGLAEFSRRDKFSVVTRCALFTALQTFHVIARHANELYTAQAVHLNQEDAVQASPCGSPPNYSLFFSILLEDDLSHNCKRAIFFGSYLNLVCLAFLCSSCRHNAKSSVLLSEAQSGALSFP